MRQSGRQDKSLGNNRDKNLTTEEQFIKQRKEVSRISSEFERTKHELEKCSENQEGSSGSLAFYLLTDNLLQSPSFRHPRWTKQTF